MGENTTVEPKWNAEEVNNFGRFHKFDDGANKVFVGEFVKPIQSEKKKGTGKDAKPEWTALQFKDKDGFLVNLPDHHQIKAVLEKNKENIANMTFRVEYAGTKKIKGGKSVTEYKIQSAPKG